LLIIPGTQSAGSDTSISRGNSLLEVVGESNEVAGAKRRADIGNLPVKPKPSIEMDVQGLSPSAAPYVKR